MLFKEYFNDDIIKHMSSDVKIYINTSLDINKYLLNSKKCLDYSASLMPIMKAVEEILYEIIVDNYLIFLKQKAVINCDWITKNFKIYDKDVGKYVIRDNIDRMEFGDALYSIAEIDHKSNAYRPNIYFLEFCKVNNIVNSDDIVIELANNL